MRILLLILIVLNITFFANAQTSFRDEPTSIKESGYSIVKTSLGYKVNVALIVSNPYDDRFASRPSVQVTLRASDNSILATKEISGAGIPPLGAIAICETFRSNEKPIRVDFRTLGAGYEATEFKSSDFKEYSLLNLRAQTNDYGDLKITGEIGNPYKKEAGAWVCFLFRDKKGKLIGGHIYWKSEVPAGEPIPFEMNIPADEVPENMASTDKMVFSHNNFQSSWHKILR